MTIETATNDVILATKRLPLPQKHLRGDLFLDSNSQNKPHDPCKITYYNIFTTVKPLKNLKNFRFSPSRSYPCSKTVRPLLNIKLLQPLAKSTAIQNLQTEQKPNFKSTPQADFKRQKLSPNEAEGRESLGLKDLAKLNHLFSGDDRSTKSQTLKNRF